jgi:hypothetical protein
MEFNTNGYQVIRGALGQEAATLLGMQFQLVRDHMLFLNNGDTNDFQFMNDPQVKNSFSYYATVGFDTLLEYIRPKVAEVTGKRLLPAYSYARIYYNGAEMAPHTDRPACQYSATMTIKIDKTPWDIWIKGVDGAENPVSLFVGDMLVYRGDILKHWRNPYQEDYQIQVFLHYVDADGPYANQHMDTRPLLGLPKEYRNPDVLLP